MKKIKSLNLLSLLVLLIFSATPLYATLVDNGDGTVTDTDTNLMWVKSQNLIGESHPGFDNDNIAGDGRITFQHASDFVAGMNAGTYTNFGQTDWRVPTIKELLSIVDFSALNPAIDTTFPCLSESYWSQTTHAEQSDEALCVYFYNGLIMVVPKTSASDLQKTSACYVRPVRDVVPTMVGMSSFEAIPGNNSVTLQWSTESEINNAGFNILRAESFEKINPAIIPAKGSPASGATYTFTDDSAENRKTYLYILEDVDTAGKVTQHGPKSATPRLINR